MNFFGCIPRFLKAHAGCIPRFLKAHAGWVLNGIGTVGFGATVILAAKEAPRAKEAVDDAQLERFEAWTEDKTPEETNDMIELSDEAFLTRWEKFKIAFPIYLPAVLSGAGTLACFWGGQIFNARKQTALIAAYGLLATEYDQYRQVIRETQGEDTDKQAYILAHKKTRELEEEIRRLKEEYGPFHYEFAFLPGVIVKARPDQISNALMHYNRNMMLRGYNDLAELYTFAGIPDSCYDKKEAREYGWQDYENEAGFGMSYVDFEMQEVQNKYLGKIYVINSIIPPYELEVDYGFEGCVEDRYFKAYDPDAAIDIAKNINGEPSEFSDIPYEIIVVNKDHLCFAPSIYTF